MNVDRLQKGHYRFYRVGKKELPSVTTVLGIMPKPKIVLWAVIQTIKFLKDRGDLSKASTSLGFGYYERLLNSLAQEGTDIHKIIENYVTKNEKVKSNALDRYIEFEKSSGFKCLEAEKYVWNFDPYRTAGTADLVGECDGIKILLDLKTSKALRLSHKIQSTIYKELYCELNKIDPTTMKSGVLLIPRNSKTKWDLHINTPEEEEQYKDIFILLSELFHTLWNLGEIGLDN